MKTAVYTYHTNRADAPYQIIEPGKTFSIQNPGVPGGAFIESVELTFTRKPGELSLGFFNAKDELRYIDSVESKIEINDFLSMHNIHLRLKNKNPMAIHINKAVITFREAREGEAEYTTPPYQWKNVIIGGGGGFIPYIVYSPIERGLTYLGTDMGGMYRKEPNDTQYVQLSNWQRGVDLQGVESIAPCPVDKGRVYAAMGTYARNTCMIARSDDYGKTWAQMIQMPFYMGANMAGRGAGPRLAVNPTDSNQVFFGTRGKTPPLRREIPDHLRIDTQKGNESAYGLYRSNDAGLTWKHILPLPKDTGSNGITWVTFDVENKRIFIGMHRTHETAPSIFHSLDGGDTWAPVPNQPTAKNAYSNEDGTVAAHRNTIAPFNGIIAGKHLIVNYTTHIGPYNGGSRGAVYKLDLQTLEWHDISPSPFAIGGNKPGGERVEGFGGLTVCNGNPDIIMTATANLWEPDEQILRTVDGGKTWSPMWEMNGDNTIRTNKYNDIVYKDKVNWLDWGRPGRTGTYAAGDQSPKLGWMIYALAIDPFNPDSFLYATGATVYGSDNLTNLDSGQKIDIEVKADGVEQCAVLGLISPTEGAHLISGVGDISGFVHHDFTKSHKMIFPRDENGEPIHRQYRSLDYAGNDPKIIATYSCDHPRGSHLILSRDGGDTWEALPAPTETPAHVDFASVVLSADGKSLLFARGMGSDPAWSFDIDGFGPNWLEVTGPECLNGKARYAADRVNPLVMYAYNAKKTYKSEDSGKSFSLIGEGEEEMPEEATPKAVPFREGHIWLAGGESGLWHSADGGKTYRKQSSQNITSVAFGKGDMIFVQGTFDGIWGIYASENGGDTFARINDDIHQFANVKPYILEADMRVQGRVYLAVDGGGIIMGNRA
ncbi:MAG: hypothetical protein FWE90_08835 [Defluviitaleaceae bacterium]|nr:hypothetical protein [Defluviitaleaceae bacterium]